MSSTSLRLNSNAFVNSTMKPGISRTRMCMRSSSSKQKTTDWQTRHIEVRLTQPNGPHSVTLQIYWTITDHWAELLEVRSCSVSLCKMQVATLSQTYPKDWEFLIKPALGTSVMTNSISTSNISIVSLSGMSHARPCFQGNV